MNYPKPPIFLRSEYWKCTIELIEYDKHIAICKIVESNNRFAVGAGVTLAIEELALWDDVTIEYLVKKEVDEFIKE